MHEPGQQRHERRLVRIAERRMRARDDEVHLVAVVAVATGERHQLDEQQSGDDQYAAAERRTVPGGRFSPAM